MFLCPRMKGKPYKVSHPQLTPDLIICHFPSFTFCFPRYPSASLVAPHPQNAVSHLHICDHTIPSGWEAFSLPFPLPQSTPKIPFRFGSQVVWLPEASSGLPAPHSYSTASRDRNQQLINYTGSSSRQEAPALFTTALAWGPGYLLEIANEQS